MASAETPPQFYRITNENFNNLLRMNGVRMTGTIEGGSDEYTRGIFSLPEGVQLPFRHFKVTFPARVDVKTTNSSFRKAMGENVVNRIICPEVSKGASEKCSFFVSALSDLESSLHQFYPDDETARQDISMVCSKLQQALGKPVLTPSQRKWTRVLLYSFILSSADALRLSDDLVRAADALRDSLSSYKGGKRTLSDALMSIMKKAFAKYNSNLGKPNDSTNVTKSVEHTSPLDGNGKRQRDLDEAQCYPFRLVSRKMGDGHASASHRYNHFDGSLDSVLPWQEKPDLSALEGPDDILADNVWQNSTFMHDPFAEAHLSMFIDDENPSHYW